MIALSEIAAKCEGVKWKGDNAFVAKCPAHDDGRASFNSKQADSGKILVYCHTGCTKDEIASALGIEDRDLFPDDTRRKKKFTLDDFSAAKKLPKSYLVERGLFDRADGGIGIPYRDKNGNPIAIKQRLHLVAKKGSKWPRGQKLVAYGVERLARARDLGVLHLVEGESDQLTLDHAGYAALGIPGASSAKVIEAQHLDGVRTIYVVHEPDDGGAKFIPGVSARLRALEWKGNLFEVKLPTKDPSDLWVRDPLAFSVQYQAALDAATAIDFQTPPASKPPADPSRPRIKMRPQLHEVVIETINALKTASLFQRGGVLVNILCEQDKEDGITRPPNTPRIALLPRPRLRELMSECADWYRVKDNGEETAVPPPGDVADMVASRGDWPGIPRLEGLSEVPILRPDGTIHNTPGHDPITGVVYTPPRDGAVSVDDKPDRAAALEARERLLDLLVDFPFQSDAHKAAALAAMLTPFARPAFAGSAPLFLIDSNVRGAGKGLLCDVIAMLYSNRHIARTALPNTDDEMRKRITAVALAGDPIVLIDNIGTVLGFPSLDNAITAPVWGDRILGVSQNTPAIPMRMTWLCTGNNVALGADMNRRIMHIRLESKEEKPEERTNYKHPDILLYVRERRLQLVAAALTVLRAYCVAGRPPVCKRLGSFEGWSDLVRSAVVWCDLPDPDVTRRQLAEHADVEKNALRTVIECFESLPNAGYTAAELIALGAKGNDHAALREAISDLCPTADGKPPSTKSLGKKLQHIKRRVIGDKCIDVMDPNKSPIRWVVKPIKEEK